MTKPVPKWLMKRYAKLWVKFREKEFGFNDALKILKEKDERVISVAIAELRKNGWLIFEKDPHDARKRLYRLKSPNKAVEELFE
ncbi:MAG: hypothetical protein NTY48_02140 [Candidatus Diapherotrites archaeon]|nr:hypothetical protein [Candidatus Diapherotrites archaeon]